MVNFQNLNFLRFLTTNSVTTGARELNRTSVILLATDYSKCTMREILMRYRQDSREYTKGLQFYHLSFCFETLLNSAFYQRLILASKLLKIALWIPSIQFYKSVCSSSQLLKLCIETDKISAYQIPVEMH